MANSIVIWQQPGHRRSRAICCAMHEGLRHMGEDVVVRSSLNYRRPEGHVAIFYGEGVGMAHTGRKRNGGPP